MGSCVAYAIFKMKEKKEGRKNEKKDSEGEKTRKYILQYREDCKVREGTLLNLNCKLIFG